MILGIGIDMTPIDRMKQALSRHDRFETRVFTDHERMYCRKHALAEQHFAARFAAKEALLKALAVPAGLSWHELEIVSGGGAPMFRLSGRAAAIAAERAISAIHLSLSHAGGQAVAMVVLEGRDKAA